MVYNPCARNLVCYFYNSQLIIDSSVSALTLLAEGIQIITIIIKIKKRTNWLYLCRAQVEKRSDRRKQKSVGWFKYWRYQMSYVSAQKILYKVKWRKYSKECLMLLSDLSDF